VPSASVIADVRASTTAECFSAVIEPLGDGGGASVDKIGEGRGAVVDGVGKRRWYQWIP
jgi:hypothetical protein